jgi:hypothetical protein
MTQINKATKTIAPPVLSSVATAILPVTPTITILNPELSLGTVRAATTMLASSILTSPSSTTTSCTYLSALVASVVTSAAPTATTTFKPDINVGPIPLPLFICLILFGPCFLTFIFWVAYRKTIHRWMVKRSGTYQVESSKRLSEEVELQVRGFSILDTNVKTKNKGSIGVAV